MKGRRRPGCSGQLRHLMMLVSVCLTGCGGQVSVDFTIGTPTSAGPADPPYGESVTFPSGLRLQLVRDPGLSASYPNPEANPFGLSRQHHYRKVGNFVDVSRAPLSQRVSENFLLSEYVAPTLQRGGRRAYVDPEIAGHLQQIRSGLGRPLVVNSAYRTPEHNRAVGGATYSRHLYGDGVDVDVDQFSVDADTRAQEIFNEAMDVGVNFAAPLTETTAPVNGSSVVSWVHLDDRGF